MAPPKPRTSNSAPKYKIAVIQLYPKPMNASHNFAKAAAQIRSAAQQGSQLAVLPEYHLLNWLPKDPKYARRCVATWRHYLREYRRLARECGICIVPGSIVKSASRGSGRQRGSVPEDEDEEKTTDPATQHTLLVEDESTIPQDDLQLENAAYFIDPTGAILHKYVKKNLWGPTERAHLASSGREAHTCFDTPLGRVGMLICWDLAFPEAFRELIAQGAKIIILPTFWLKLTTNLRPGTLSDASDAGLRHNPTAEATLVSSMVTSRAFENTCAVVFANAGGPPGRGYMGLSQVTVPFIGPVAQLGSCAEGMIVADLDMGIVEDGEDNYQIRKDIGSVGWHYDYRHGRSDWADGGGKGKALSETDGKSAKL